MKHFIRQRQFANHKVMLWPAGIILGMGPTNDKWRYIVARSLIGLAHAQNDPGPMIFVYLFSMLKISIEIFSNAKMHLIY